MSEAASFKFVLSWAYDLLLDVPVVSLKMGSNLNPEDIKEGDDVYFECNIRANPKAYKLSWYHNVSSGPIVKTLIKATSGIYCVVSLIKIYTPRVQRSSIMSPRELSWATRASCCRAWREPPPGTSPALQRIRKEKVPATLSPLWWDVSRMCFIFEAQNVPCYIFRVPAYSFRTWTLCDIPWAHGLQKKDGSCRNYSVAPVALCETATNKL